MSVLSKQSLKRRRLAQPRTSKPRIGALFWFSENEIPTWFTKVLGRLSEELAPWCLKEDVAEHGCLTLVGRRKTESLVS